MIKSDVTLNDTYFDCPVNIDKKLYVELNKAFNDFIIEKVVEGFTVTLPRRLGYFYIGGTKRDKFFDDDGNSLLPPDWGKTKKLWERSPEAKEKGTIIRHTNEETGGVSYRLIWSKRSVPFRNKVFMSFRLTKDNKKKIHKAITVDKKEYRITKIVK